MNPTIPRALAATATFAALLAACGDDQPATSAGATTAVATTGPSPVTAATPDGSSTSFCEGFLALDRAFQRTPDDPAELDAFVADHVTPNIELVEADPRAAIAGDVTVMLDTVDEVLSTGDFELFSGPEFSSAATTVYGALDDECDVPVVDVQLHDYSFHGLPTELAAGVTAFVIDNPSDHEPHQLELFKVKDGVDLPAGEIAAMPEDEVDELVDAFGGATGAMPGSGGGMTVELVPGRWIAICLIPVTGDEEHTHWQRGMIQDITVT